MKEKRIVIKNPAGLHARPATQLSKFSRKFKSEIELVSSAGSVDPKSLFSILRGGLVTGTGITIRAIGEDEDDAVNEIANFIEMLEE